MLMNLLYETPSWLWNIWTTWCYFIFTKCVNYTKMISWIVCMMLSNFVKIKLFFDLCHSQLRTNQKLHKLFKYRRMLVLLWILTDSKIIAKSVFANRYSRYFVIGTRSMKLITMHPNISKRMISRCVRIYWE